MKIGSVKIKVWTHRKKIRKHSLNLGITPGSERTSQNLSLWNDILEKKLLVDLTFFKTNFLARFQSQNFTRVECLTLTQHIAFKGEG